MKKLLFVIIFSLLFLGGCGGKTNISCGISESSQVGIKHIQPSIEAMEEFKGDNGKYPKNALELIPKYIDKVPIIIKTGESIDDETKYKILMLGNSRGGVPQTADGGDFFEVKFYSEDDRVCILGGRNNICEYSSQRPSWNCYQ